jgi:hypothetical protein
VPPHLAGEHRQDSHGNDALQIFIWEIFGILVTGDHPNTTAFYLPSTSTGTECHQHFTISITVDGSANNANQSKVIPGTHSPSNCPC